MSQAGSTVRPIGISKYPGVTCVCMDMFGYGMLTELCSPPNIFIEILTSCIIVFGDEAFKKVTKIKWGHKGWVHIQ